MSAQEAATKWTAIELPALQSNMKQMSIDITEKEQNSVLSRKNLATETKSFKKLDAQEKLGQVMSLIKMYQQEIDTLTNRAKNAETKFFTIYAALSEVPDPAPFLGTLYADNEALLARNGVLEAQVRSLESENAMLVSSQKKVVQQQETVGQLEQKLAAYSDYDAIRAELEQLKRQPRDAPADDDSAAASAAELAQQKTIVDLRMKETILSTENKQLKENVDQLREALDKQTALNSKLEQDIGQIDTMTSVTTNDDDSILPIVTKQRDRFKKRTMELEHELKTHFTTVTSLKQQLAALKQDNKQMYEKNKYLVSRRTAGDSTVHVDERQYESTYEESLHPLAAFRAKEASLYSSRMSSVERIFLGFAKVILANKSSRALFLFYVVGLHVMVMMMSVHVMGMYGAMTPEVGYAQEP